MSARLTAMDSKPLDIALWGPTMAGKTMLLARLYLQSVEFDSHWEILPTPESSQFISDMRNAISRDNVFPEPTSLAHSEQVVYLFRNRQSGASATLSIVDRAGVHYQELEEQTRQHLAQADGLLLLFDPSREKETLKREVLRTLEHIYVSQAGQSGAKDERPYAICLSKADILLKSPQDHALACQQPHKFVIERIEADLVGWLERFCRNFQLFPVSSVGVRVSEEDLEPVVFFDEKLTQRLAPDARPLNLIEPFSWLLAQLEAGS